MRRSRHRVAQVSLIVGGICGSIAGGLMAANYAVGGIDPFYSARPQSDWATDPSRDVAVTHDDFLPAMAASDRADPPLMPTAPPRFASNEDWAAIDAREQRDYDRDAQFADAATDDPVQLADFEPPVVAPVRIPDPAPPVAVAVKAPAQLPVTPDNSLIY